MNAQNCPQHKHCCFLPVHVQWFDNNGEERGAIVWATVQEDEEQVEGFPILNVELCPKNPD